MAGRSNHYREVNLGDSELHPIDDELDRRVRHGGRRKWIITAQGRVTAALGNQRQLYLHLEQFVGDRAIDREEAIFNIGFEHGLAQLATNAGLETSRTLAALLEVAWAMARGPGKPPVRAQRRRAR
jgi:hypothetical protein